MTERTDDAIWNALTERLSTVEALIPSAPSWRPEGDAVTRASVRLVRGTAFGGRSARGRGTSGALAWGLVLLALAVALAGAAILAGVGREAMPRPRSGPLRPTGSMSVYRFLHSATLLADGRVLMIGGTDQTVNFTDATRKTAELYDPRTGTFSTTGSMTEVRSTPIATRLDDGRVLVLGGTGDATAELYDPATGLFTRTGSTSVVRGNPGVMKLADGRLLVVGGNATGPGAFALSSAEIYDPTTGSFSPTAPMETARTFPALTLLHDGRVLVTGTDTSTRPATPAAEVFDPATNGFTAAGSPVDGVVGRTAALLPDGRVLVVGGRGNPTIDAEVFDPATNQFSEVGPMAAAPLFLVATDLPDGRVLFTGGDGAAPFVVEIFDPVMNRFSQVAGLTTPAFSSATVLPTGDVLIAGGFGEPPGDSMNTAFLLDSHIKGGTLP
jgi:WD40 repeat protein